ncbi:MAG: tectonin domain-containing protein [Terriglobales bacterium]|jgi:virginiamycin B lyase
MQNTIANKFSKYRTSTTASRRNKIGLLAMIAFFLCGFAVSASAASWTLVNVSSGATMTGIRVGSSQMWGHDASGHGYQYVSSTNTLKEVTTTPTLSTLAVGEGQSVWGLDTSNNIYQYSFKHGAFEIVPGTLTSIGAGEEGVWGVNSSSGQVFVYDPSTNSFNPPPHGEPSEFFESISVGNFGIGPWALDSGGTPWLYNTRTEFFDATGGTTLALVEVGDGEAWGVDSKDRVWTYDVSSETWVQPDPSASLKQVAVGSNSNVWGVNSAGQVYQFNESTLQFKLVSPQPPEAIYRVRVSTGGAGVFALANSGNTYKYK